MIGVGIELAREARNLPVRRAWRDQGIMRAGEEDDRFLLWHVHHALEGQQRYAVIAQGLAAAAPAEQAGPAAAATQARHHAAAALKILRRLDIHRREELRHAAIGEDAHPLFAVDLFELRQVLQERPELHIESG